MKSVICLLGLFLSLGFSALVTDPNDARNWQGATVGTFARLFYGDDTPATRQQLIDAKILDDGVITANLAQTGTLIPNSWSNSYSACRGDSTNNGYGYTCSSPRNVFELANNLDTLFFQSSGTIGQTVWDLGVDAPQAVIFVTVDHGPLPLEVIESSHYLAPTPNGPWTLTEVVKVFLQGYLADSGNQNIYDGFAYVVRHPSLSAFRYISSTHGGPGALQSDGDDEINGVAALNLNGDPIKQPFTECVNISTIVGGTRVSVNPVQLSGRFTSTAQSNYGYNVFTNAAGGVGNPKPRSNSLQVFLSQDYANVFALNIMIDANDGTGGTAVVTLNTKNLGPDAQIIVFDDPNSATPVDDAVDSYSWFPSTGQGQFTWSWGASTTDGLVIGPVQIVGATFGFVIELEVTASNGLSEITIVSQPAGANADQLTYTTYPVNQKLTLVRESCYCGNGVVDPLEQCDGTPCCTPQCTISSGGVLCRAGKKDGNPCDLPENCDGVSADCPADVVLNGTDCNPFCPPGYSGSGCATPICSYWTACDSCTNVTGCGWCCGTSSCISGDATGPSAGVSCPTFQYGTCDCNPACGPAGTCVCGKCQCNIGRSGPTCDEYIGCDGKSYPTKDLAPTLDVCGKCQGDNSSCIGCDGIPFGKQYDHCGVCGGDGKSCQDSCGALSDCESCTSKEGGECQWCFTAQFCADKVHTYECPDDNYVQEKAKCVQILGLTVEEAAGLGAGVIAAIAVGAAAFAGLAIFGGKKGYDVYMKNKNNLSGAQSNPMYNDNGRTGNNPFYGN